MCPNIVTYPHKSSQQQPKKSTSTDKLNKSNESGSKIAAFLPARQLWAWQGKGFKRSAGRVKKLFYRSIQRGKETISVSFAAVRLELSRLIMIFCPPGRRQRCLPLHWAP